MIGAIGISLGFLVARRRLCVLFLVRPRTYYRLWREFSGVCSATQPWTAGRWIFPALITPTGWRRRRDNANWHCA